MDYTVHGTLQARILEWVTFPSSGDPPNPGIELVSPALQVDYLPAELPGKPKLRRERGTIGTEIHIYLIPAHFWVQIIAAASLSV